MRFGDAKFLGDIKMEKEKKKLKKNVLAIVICWLVYTCSYLGKLGYNANIVLIESEFGVSHAESGTVGTAFFFAYGAGQIINGLLCKKYNAKYTIFCALVVSAACNFAVAVIRDFAWLKVVWLVNGMALSFLWSLLIRYLSEVLDEKFISKAVVIMGTTVATGTFAVYGLSALFVSLNAYKTIFYVASALLPAIAIAWFIAHSIIGNGTSSEKQEQINELPVVEKKKVGFDFIALVAVLAVFAMITNLEKDGINVWVPAILKELYEMPDYLSILLTLCLPLVAIFGTMVAVFLNKYIKDFVTLCGAFFLATMFTLAVNIAIMRSSVVITLVCLSLISLFMSGTNNVITSMVPLYYKDKANAGLLAGVLNGCCYIGSTLSSYGLGAVADAYGWESVFYLLLACAALCCFITAITIIISHCKSSKTHPKS